MQKIKKGTVLEGQCTTGSTHLLTAMYIYMILKYLSWNVIDPLPWTPPGTSDFAAIFILKQGAVSQQSALIGTGVICEPLAAVLVGVAKVSANSSAVPTTAWKVSQVIKYCSLICSHSLINPIKESLVRSWWDCWDPKTRPLGSTSELTQRAVRVAIEAAFLKIVIAPEAMFFPLAFGYGLELSFKVL